MPLCPSYLRRLLPVIFLNLALLPNISCAVQPQDTVPHKGQLDLRAQKEIDAISQIMSPRVLLAIPYREHFVSPTEEDFHREACKYDLREKHIEGDLLSAIKKSHLQAYKKSQGWYDTIVEIDYVDSEGNSHAFRFDQNYPNDSQINGYFDGHPLTADADLVRAIYRIILGLRTNNPCDPYISPYLK